MILLGRPSTAWPQTATYRPGSALKPQSAFRPPTGVGHSACHRSTPDSGRPSSSSRPVSTLSFGEQSLIFLSLLISCSSMIKPVDRTCYTHVWFPISPMIHWWLKEEHLAKNCCHALEKSVNLHVSTFEPSNVVVYDIEGYFFIFTTLNNGWDDFSLLGVLNNNTNSLLNGSICEEY